MRLYVLLGFCILPQICIPEGQGFELGALEYFNAMASARKRGGESHVRSTFEFDLVFVPRGRFFERLTSPNWLLAKWPEVARTEHKQHGHMKPIPRVRAQAHDAFSLRR